MDHDPPTPSRIATGPPIGSPSVRAILDRLEPELEILDLAFAYTAPEATVRALLRGLPLDLELSHHYWGPAAEVLNRIREFDPLVAKEVAIANAPQMAIGLASSNTAEMWDGMTDWIKACDVAAPGLIDEVIRGLPEGVVRSWRGGLSRNKKYGPSRRREVEPLVRRALSGGGHAAAEAEALLRKFPSLRSGLG